MSGSDTALCVLSVWLLFGPMFTYLVPNDSIRTSESFIKYLFVLGPVTWFLLLVVLAKDKQRRIDFFQRMQTFDGE